MNLTYEQISKIVMQKTSKVIAAYEPVILNSLDLSSLPTGTYWGDLKSTDQSELIFMLNGSTMLSVNVTAVANVQRAYHDLIFDAITGANNITEDTEIYFVGYKFTMQ